MLSKAASPHFHLRPGITEERWRSKPLCEIWLVCSRLPQRNGSHNKGVPTDRWMLWGCARKFGFPDKIVRWNSGSFKILGSFIVSLSTVWISVKKYRVFWVNHFFIFRFSTALEIPKFRGCALYLASSVGSVSVGESNAYLSLECGVGEGISASSNLFHATAIFICVCLRTIVRDRCIYKKEKDQHFEIHNQVCSFTMDTILFVQKAKHIPIEVT